MGNFWWESLDYAYRHTSLNGFQAHLDPDGRFRAVVAHRDPGVANWLDTCGHARGPMLFRWIVADHAPEPTCTVVPFAEVHQHLPEGTRTVSPAERQAIIATRRDGVLRRFSPDAPSARSPGDWGDRGGDRGGWDILCRHAN